MIIDKNAVPTKLLWIDLEMTGLNPDKDVIIEVAAEVSDFDLNTLESYEALIKQPEEVLADSNEWSLKQHTESGLYDRVRKEGKHEDDVKQGLIEFIKKHFGDEPAILAGNSIYNDRMFINKHWPEVNALLHYRMLDVSSFKILMQGRYGVPFEKKDAHRAFDDIQASIAELDYYVDWFKNGQN